MRHSLFAVPTKFEENRERKFHKKRGEKSMETLIAINSAVNGIVWGIPMLILLVGTGVYLSIRTNFLQFRKFGYAMKNTLGKVFHKREAGHGEVTPFQALSTALASTVGTGNVAGVTGAIVLGGPGAVFWMWVSALFGMITKYSEVVLAVKFRERNAHGDWVGGPMYYITNGLGKNWRWLAILFSAFGAVAAFGIGNIAQINSIASSVNSTIQAFYPDAAAASGAISLGVGIIIAAFCGLVLLGGLKRIGSVAEKFVPFMAVVYILSALIVIITHIGSIGQVIGDIFYYAFNAQAIIGGTFGSALMLAIQKGVGRGVFSNEAGLGSAPMAHAATSETNPVKQGLYGIFEVFVDTIVICTLTALAVLCSGVTVGNYGNKDLAGVTTTINAFTSTYGAKAGSLIIAFGLLLFATSTILGWALYGTRCCEYLFGTKSIRTYQILFILVVVLGAVMDLSLVWEISDTLNGLMALPNLVGVIGLSGVVITLTKRHFKRRETLQ